MVGLSVGDALGAGEEGRPFTPERLRRGIRIPDSVAPWTDDTQMALSVVEVLLREGAIDADQLASGFASRYERWRGYGAGMHVLLRELRAGVDWKEARYRVFPEGSFGNGSAMRVAPLGAFHLDHGTDVVVADAERSAQVTHPHPEARAGAVAVAVSAWCAARSRQESPPGLHAVLEAVPLDGGLEVVKRLRLAETLAGAPLEEAIRHLGNGGAVSCPDTVPLALWIAFSNMDDFRAAIELAVGAGGDTDTLGAIVGGVVGARVGTAGIPAEWRTVVEPLPLLDAT